MLAEPLSALARRPLSAPLCRGVTAPVIGSVSSCCKALRRLRSALRGTDALLATGVLIAGRSFSLSATSSRRSA